MPHSLLTNLKNYHRPVSKISFTLAIFFYTNISWSNNYYDNHVIKGYISFASDYTYRGLTNSNGDPNTQFSLNFAHRSGFYSSLWLANHIDISKSDDSNEDIYQTDLQIGYQTRIYEHIDIDFAISQYRYSGEDFIQYNTRYELHTAITVSEQHTVSLDYLPKTLGYRVNPIEQEQSSFNLAYDWSKSLRGNYTIGLGIGRYNLEKLFENSYNYWSIGLSKTFTSALVDVNYSNSSSQAEKIFGADASDERFFIRVTIPLF